MPRSISFVKLPLIARRVLYGGMPRKLFLEKAHHEQSSFLSANNRVTKKTSWAIRLSGQQAEFSITPW
jgi:hypothetical protein